MFCKICNNEYSSYISLSKHLRSHNITTKDYYIRYINNGNIGFCQTCNKETKFSNLEKGFNLYCSSSCVSKNKEIKLKKKKTLLKNYNVEYPLQNTIVKEKYKNTMISKYGAKSVLESELLRNKISSTIKEKYNVEHLSQSKIIKSKKKETYLKKFGVDHISKCEQIKEQKKLKSLNKYGVEYVFQSDIVKNKIKDSNLTKYGVNYFSKSNLFKEKITNTLRIKNFLKLLKSEKFNQRVVPNFNINDYQGIGNNKDFQPKYEWICRKCNSIFLDRINNGHIPRCLKCFPLVLENKSIYEDEIFEFLKSIYNKEIIRSNRTILTNNLELDIYLPLEKLAIEFNGLYWHSEISGNKKWDYHLNKTKLCQNKDIRLIHIFEDEWINKKEIVKSIIKSKLNLTNKIFARKCRLREINDYKTIEHFYSNNHLQGFINGIHIGLYYNNILVSCLSVGKPRFNKNFEYEILRFCSKNEYTIVGGLSKLFKYFISKYTPKNVITYCDLRYGNGKSYEKIGFTFFKETKPSYYYLKNGIRKNRLNFRKHILMETLDQFDSNLTEWENMQLNNYDRIWDCGNISYKYGVLNNEQ